MPYNTGDDFARRAALEEKPPTGRVHLHLFIARRGAYLARMYDDAGKHVGTTTLFHVEWRVSRRPSSVCKVPGRCILADIVAQEGAEA